MPRPPSVGSEKYAEQIREHQRQMREASQRMAQSRKRSYDMNRFGQGLHRFSRVLWMVGLGFMIGGFAVSISRFSIGRGLVIAALCVASVELVLVLVLRVVPLFAESPIRDHITLSVAPVLGQDIGNSVDPHDEPVTTGGTVRVVLESVNTKVTGGLHERLGQTRTSDHTCGSVIIVVISEGRFM